MDEAVRAAIDLRLSDLTEEQTKQEQIVTTLREGLNAHRRSLNEAIKNQARLEEEIAALKHALPETDESNNEE